MKYIPSEIFYISCVVFVAIIIALAIRLRQVKGKLSSTVINDNKSETLVQQIEQGFENQEFKMHLQFIVDNKTKQIVSAEALSRWEKDNGKLVPPGEYIGTMKDCGIIARLDYYMFEKACKKLEQWKTTEFEGITLSCNFTRITISEQDFVQKIAKIANGYDFDRSKLLLEITEDSKELNADGAMENITRIREMGFQVAVDDLGSGYTSFLSLCKYPINVVKIDREMFLKTCEENGQKVFWAIVALAHDLNMSVVCEGVETEEQNQFVTESNCDMIQGWYYSRALPEQEAEAFARAYMAKTC